MEVSHRGPKCGISASRGDVHRGNDHGDFLECTNGDSGDDAKGASTAPSQRPEQLRILVGIGSH